MCKATKFMNDYEASSPLMANLFHVCTATDLAWKAHEQWWSNLFQVHLHGDGAHKAHINNNDEASSWFVLINAMCAQSSWKPSGSWTTKKQAIDLSLFVDLVNESHVHVHGDRAHVFRQWWWSNNSNHLVQSHADDEAYEQLRSKLMIDCELIK